ncbi:ATP-binding cassette domain-containing protein [bacterium]|nr:ATP-binding cassette domain-containing protein [bacterium]
MTVSPAAPFLRVSNLTKTFDTLRAVDGVSFEVRRGEIFGLLGPNGAGKTTTIRAMIRILESDAGEVTFDGQPFTDATRDKIGYLPEERGLYRKSRVLDTILYFAELRGMHRGAAKAEALKWLERFNLRPDAGRKVEELSKGNQQKIQFIAAVLHDPELVILDEPFSGLDPVNQILFKDIFMELRERGKAVIFSTHQMDQAEKLSDALCLINRGRVVLSGTVRDVKRQYGTNTLHLEYEGNGDFLRALPGIRRAEVFGNAAELDLEEGTRVSDVLGHVNGKLELRKLELREPSLEAIFVQTVSGGKETAS